MRIAYVEDNPTNLALVERVAGMNKHVIVSYNEGEVAVKELLLEKFDLILMDVELAGELGGLAVVRQLRANGLNTPIVAVTAYAMMGDRDKCLEAGCDDYLPKPLPIVELVAMLARYDEQARRIAAGEPVPERKVRVPVVAEATPVAPASPVSPVPAAPVVPAAPAVSTAPTVPAAPVAPSTPPRPPASTTVPTPANADVKPAAPAAPPAPPTIKVEPQTPDTSKGPEIKVPPANDKTLQKTPDTPVEATATPDNKQRSDQH